MTTAAARGILTPVKMAEDLQPQNKPFPEGAWNGTIEETRVRSIDFLKGRSPEELTRQGYTSDDVEALSLQIGKNTPLEGQEDVGGKKFFTPDIIVRDGAFSITDEEIPERAWQLERSRRALTNLANALDQAEQVDTEDGPAYLVPGEFVDALLAEQFNGQEIGFIVYHQPWKSKRTGKEGVAEEVKSYIPAV